jgi:hypothetical protein
MIGIKTRAGKGNRNGSKRKEEVTGRGGIAWQYLAFRQLLCRYLLSFSGHLLYYYLFSFFFLFSLTIASFQHPSSFFLHGLYGSNMCRIINHQFSSHHKISHHITSCISHLPHLFSVSFYSIEFYQLVMSSSATINQ